MFEPIVISPDMAPEIRISRRARRISLTVNSRGEVRLTVPPRCPNSKIEAFLSASRPWLVKKLSSLDGSKHLAIPSRERVKHYRAHREPARRKLHARVHHFSGVLGADFAGLSIRNQKTRWGSCSKKGNVSLSYKLVFLPAELSDYVVVHELCHLKEFNHSKKFWAHVARVLPNYRDLRKELETYRLD